MLRFPRFLKRSIHCSAAVRGALTSKPYSFTARPWDLADTETIDNFNSLGSAITLQTKGNELKRVVPRINDDINEEWIDDKTRFSYDGHKLQRLTRPIMPNAKNPFPHWRHCLGEISRVLKEVKSEKLKARAIVNPTVDLGGVVALSDFLDVISENPTVEVARPAGNGLKSVEDTAFGNDLPLNYRFNSSIVNFDECDVCLLVGANLHNELPQLIHRIENSFMADTIKLAQVGFCNEFPYPVENLGLSPKVLVEILKGQNSFAEDLKQAENPMIVVDDSIYEREDADLILATLYSIANSKDFPNITMDDISFLHAAANDVGIAELGRTTTLKSNSFSSEDKSDVIYLMHVSADDLPNGHEDIQRIRDSCKVLIYQGSHGDELASVADFILPSGDFVERKGIYANVEGRFQESRAAVPVAGIGRQDWEILRALSEVMVKDHGNKILPYEEYSELVERINSLVPGTTMPSRDKIVNWSQGNIKGLMEVIKAKVTTEGVKDIQNVPFRPRYTDFYLDGHANARVSSIMAGCSQDNLKYESNFQ